MTAALVALAGLLFLGTALPLLPVEAWWVRSLDFPRPQLAVLSAALAGALVWLGEGVAGDVAAGALGLCVVYQAARIFPYTPLAPRQVEPGRAGPQIRLLVANVLMESRGAARLREIVRECDPDLVLVLENDDWWTEQLAALEPGYPHRVAHPLDNTYGILLLSRLELVEPRVRFLVEPDIPSIHTIVRLRGGAEVSLHCVHPRPPVPNESARSTERDAELLLVGKAVKGETRPVIVAGDLNDVAWSHTTRLFQDTSGLLDPRIGRGMYGTFPAGVPFLRWPVDHVFHSRHFRLADLRRLPRFGSDHLPVCVTLSYEPDGAATQEEPAADAGERREAEDKIARGAGGGAARAHHWRAASSSSPRSLR